MQTSRLFRLLYILLEHGRVPAAELARELEVSVRTVYRDVQSLCEAGVPLYAERGRNGGVAILPSFKLSRSMVSGAEKRDILASLQAMTTVGASEKATLDKLRAVFGGESADWVRIDFSDWSGEGGAMIATLKDAILSRRPLGFDYYNTAGMCAPRRVCPIRLWFKSSAWYLLAYCTDRHAVRTFKLTRIKRLAILSGDFPPEALGALDTEPEDIQPNISPLSFTMKVDGCMAFRVYDDFEESQVARTESGDFLVHAAFIPNEWLISFILSYGEHAQVLDPPSLRLDVENAIQNIAARYKI